jgi:hypothetical protein
MKEIMTKELSDMMLNTAEELKRAAIFEGSTQRPFSVQSLTLSLDTARLSTDPLRIGFPFKSFFVADATDTSVLLNMKVNGRDEIQSWFPFHKNDSWNSSTAISEAYLYWAAQSGKTVTIIFFTDAEFKSGSQIAVQSGGVTISEGSSTTAIARVTLTAATAGVIAPADTLRIVTIIQNKTGADLYIGGTSAVTNSGATEGIKVPADGIIYWKNTANLHAYSVAGGNVHYFTER